MDLISIVEPVYNVEQYLDRCRGWSYLKKYRSGRKIIFKTGYISWLDYTQTIIRQLRASLCPNSTRQVIYHFFKKIIVLYPRKELLM